jgi:DNA replication protein DnaC
MAMAEDAYQKALTFAHREGPHVLMLAGQVDAGKSHLLEAIGRELLERNIPVRYETVPDWLEKLRHTYEKDSEHDLEELMRWYDLKVLLLDDLGAEATTDWAKEKLFRVIDGRIRNGGWLAVATNCTESQMKERMGARIASRLYQTGDLGEVSLVMLSTTRHRTERPSTTPS